MKKILLLGGAESQLPAIKAAKELGYYTVLCDYLTDNPGRNIADEWYPASTTDYSAVLEVAKEREIDGVLTYGSDVASSTAAYVAEKLGLPGSPFESVYTLSHKDKFRDFLKRNGFNTPRAGAFGAEERQQATEFIREIGLPVMIKPTDSQGAKGVTKINSIGEAAAAIDTAISYSRSQRFIVEEYIQRKGMQVGGDGFSIDGELVITPFSNSYFSDEEGARFVPLGEFWPPMSSPDLLNRMRNEFQRAISLLGMRTQAYTFEAIEDVNGKIYILEIGPRNGGTMIPVISDIMTGQSMIKATIRAAVSDPIEHFKPYSIDGYWATRSINSKTNGRLDGISFDKEFKERNLLAFEQYVKMGETVSTMKNTGDWVGCAAAKFATREEMMDFVRFPEKYVKPEVSDKCE